MSAQSDLLETDFGTVILEELTGKTLTHEGQPVRLFDQSRHSAERYYPEDEQHKPYIQDFAQGKRWYPLTAWMQSYDMDWKTAVADLSRRYLGDTKLTGKRSLPRRQRPLVELTPPAPVSYHDPALVASTLGHYERNDFAIYLRRLLGVGVADELLSRFRVGTGLHWHVSEWWPRSTIFWQIDQENRIRAGKIISYSAPLGKRLKDDKAGHRPHWLHEIRSMTDFHVEQCLFGLHQLSEQPVNKPVAVVESEKSAIIATAFMPGFVWLATGGLGNLNPERFKVLANRNIMLFPDLKGFDLWSRKAVELRKVVGSVSVSGILESRATPLERDAGLDLADFLTRHRCAQTGRVLTEPDGPPFVLTCPAESGTRRPADNPQQRADFVLPPMAWDADRVYRFIRWAVIPNGYDETNWPPQTELTNHQ